MFKFKLVKPVPQNWGILPGKDIDLHSISETQIYTPKIELHEHNVFDNA